MQAIQSCLKRSSCVIAALVSLEFLAIGGMFQFMQLIYLDTIIHNIILYYIILYYIYYYTYIVYTVFTSIHF